MELMEQKATFKEEERVPNPDKCTLQQNDDDITCELSGLLCIPSTIVIANVKLILNEYLWQEEKRKTEKKGW